VKWYKFHVADYQMKTIHLADAEDLAYRRLLDMCYMTERPIPLDTHWVARRIRLDLDVVEAVLNDFFERTEEGYRNARVDEEISNYNAIVDRNAANSKKAAERALERSAAGIKRKSPKKDEPTGFPLGTQIEPTGGQNKNKNISPLPPLGGFDRFWEVWPRSPRKVGKADCMKRWVRHGMEEHADRIVAHVAKLKTSTQWLSGFEPAPQTYLNQKRWLDDEVATTALPFGRKVL